MMLAVSMAPSCAFGKTPVLVTAHAGKDQAVYGGANVQLGGSCDDKLNREFSYKWKQTLGPSVRLSSTDRADPIFTAPKIKDGQTILIAFRFTCSAADGGGSSTDIVIIKVRPADNAASGVGHDRNVPSKPAGSEQKAYENHSKIKHADSSKGTTDRK